MQPERQRSQASSIVTDVKRCRSGDADAADALARRATRLALRTSAALMESREEAADVAQDIAVDVLISLG